MSKEKDCRWHFADQIGGREDGPNDAVTQNLKGSPYSTLIREAFQNALDAAQGPAADKGPVRVEVSFGSINGLDFPNYMELGKHIQGCLDCFPDNEQAKSLYEPMLESFNEDSRHSELGYIKVADYNTNGMDYVSESDPNYRKKPFYAFVRSVGVHANDSDGSGGSYGFGKAAYFLISPMRTLMVSTLTNTGRYFFEGVSALCTHTFEGKTKVSVGFYDNNDGLPTCIPDRIPKPFRREEAGTNFYLMGTKFSDKERDQVKDEMLRAAVRNFWMSILRGNLVAVIDNVEINKRNIDAFMSDLFPSLIDNYKSQMNHNPRPYYEAYVNSGKDDVHKCFTTNLPNLGKVQFYAFLTPEADDRVCFMRGLQMFVYRKKSQTGAAFYGLFLCEDMRGNLILRDMEPPRHDDWDASWARKYPKDLCQEAENEYKNFITECIKQLHPDDDARGLNVNGGEDVFASENFLEEDDEVTASNAGASGNIGNPSGETQEEENGTMTTEIDPKEPDIAKPGNAQGGSVRRTDSGWKPDPEGKNKGGIRTRGKDKKKRKGRGNQPGNHPVNTSPDNSEVQTYVYATCRPICQRVNGILYHDLIIRPEEDIVNGEIELLIGGEESTEKMSIVYSDQGVVSDNCISGIQLFKDRKNVIRVRFEDNLRHSVNLVAYECK